MFTHTQKHYTPIQKQYTHAHTMFKIILAHNWLAQSAHSLSKYISGLHANTVNKHLHIIYYSHRIVASELIGDRVQM